MRLGLSQNMRVEQRQIQSPQMIQAMQVLQYPLMELQDRIDQELQDNVFLDLKEPEPNTPEQAKIDDGTPAETSKYEEDYASNMARLEELERRGQDYGSSRRVIRGDDTDPKQEALNNTPGPGETLSEHLLDQVLELELSDDERERVELVIYSLDRDGRLVTSVEDLAEEGECTIEEMEEAVEVIQSLEPRGVGARSLEECLVLQLDSIPGSPPLARRLCESQLENLSMNRLPRIARETGASIEEVKDAIEYIRTHLHPHPGAPFGEVRNHAITPDIVVEEVDGRFETRVEKGGIPELSISPIYRKLLKESKPDPKVQEYLRKKIESAKWFMDAIFQRQNTIQRIASAIVAKQSEFLRKGIRALKPLRMQDIADEVGVHISTVSRATSGKYIQTPQGIFDMKRFFSSGTMSDSGEMVSQQAIKQKLKEIIEKEDTSKPLSDDAIVSLLVKDGIKIARRTVTKYRKALGIPSSTQRRSY